MDRRGRVVVPTRYAGFATTLIEQELAAPQPDDPWPAREQRDPLGVDVEPQRLARPETPGRRLEGAGVDVLHETHRSRFPYAG